MPATTAVLSLVIFGVAYLLFALFPTRRSGVSLGGAALLILTGSLAVPPQGNGDAVLPDRVVAVQTAGEATPLAAAVEGVPAYPERVVASFREAVGRLVRWNVLGLFFGTMLLAEVFLLSRAPAVIAEALLSHLSSARAAMLALCVLSGFISMFIENVAVVMLLSPIAFSLAKKLDIRPTRLLIGVAVSSNLQGTATMIGDSPSMILAGAMRMGFFDFFVYQGRIGIFFAVQAGAIASLGVLAWFFRKHRAHIHIADVEKARSWLPAVFLVLLVVGLTMASGIDPDFRWYAGTLAMTLAAVASLWYARYVQWGTLRELARCLDWDTTLFLVGVFVIVGGLSESGWLERLADVIATRMGGNLAGTYLLIVALSVVLSGFVDNVPFLLAMIPVVQSIAGRMGGAHGVADPLPVLIFGMLVGACLGGNVTPIGASANVVTLGLLRRHGETVRFRDFMRLSIPFTVAAVTASGLFIWWVWAR